MQPLAAMVLRAIEKEGNAFKVFPPSSLGILNNWLNDIEDWCISRQLWWGHKIPLFYPIGDKTSPIAAKTLEEAKKLYPGELVEESDVLDTWFSSCLLPLSAVNGPCHPISILETGSDILFFWVARMMLLCTFLSGELPFSTILLHGMVGRLDYSSFP